MFDTILDAVKGEITESLSSKLGLNGGEIDKTISSTKEAFDKTVSEETKSNGMDNILNLFSSADNTSSSNGILESLGGNLLSSLSSNGFGSDQAASIKNLVLPIVMKIASDKIGGDSSMLTSLLGNSDLLGKASGLVKGFFNK